MTHGALAAPPRLSVVAASRNDDHGGRLQERMQIFVDSLAQQAVRVGLTCELVLVEWNPPADRPGLREALRWPSGSAGFEVRILKVPPALHARLAHADRLPLFQMIAKNVGIRRARGEFILATNVDVLFSTPLIRRLATDLDPARMYRVDRYDVDRDVPLDAGIDEKLAYCERHVIRVCRREMTENRRSHAHHRVLPPLGLRGRLSDRLQDLGILSVRAPSRLHTNACGDFTLLHRDAWLRLRGYPELQAFSMHLDSLLCHEAHHAGYLEHVLPDPARVYHIEHDTGSGFTPEGEAQMNARIREAGIPRIDNEQFRRWAMEIRSRRAPLDLNGPDWGLWADDLIEERIDCGGADA